MPLEIAGIDFDLKKQDDIIHSKINKTDELNNTIKESVILVFGKGEDNGNKKQTYSTNGSPLD